LLQLEPLAQDSGLRVQQSGFSCAGPSPLSDAIRAFFNQRFAPSILFACRFLDSLPLAIQ
jgi:hypothetical protein